MIVGDLKALDEIIASLKGCRRILAVGCGSCVSVCLSGGDREARELARELSRTRYYAEDPPLVNCDYDRATVRKGFFIVVP